MRNLIHIAAALLLFLSTACGAPSKSAGAVRHLFAAETASLEEKVDGFCTTLATRQQAPRLDGQGLSLSDCERPGELAMNLTSLKNEFTFAGFDSLKVPDGEFNTIKFKTRSQIWLNHGLLALASKLLETLNDGTLKPGKIDIASAKVGSDLENLIKADIELLNEPKFNFETREFATSVRVKLTGVIKAEHLIKIDGKIIDEMIAVQASSTEDTPFEKSVLKNFHAMLLVVPHARDIYADALIRLEAHGFGVDSVLKQKIKETLSGGMKTAIDSLLDL